MYSSKITYEINDIKADLFTKRDVAVESVKTEEEVINGFLDQIIELNARIKQIYLPIEAIIPKLEKLSWFSDVEEVNEDIIEIISLTKEYKSLLTKLYVVYNNSSVKRALKTELKNFKSGIDDLKETCEDLEFVFVDSKNDEEMIRLNKQISEL